MKTLIQGGCVIGFDGENHELIEDGVVVYEGDEIVFVGKSYPGDVDEIIDATGKKLVSPGFVDAEAVTGIDIQGFATDIGRKDFFGPSGWNFAPSKSDLEEATAHPQVGSREETRVAAEFGTALCLKAGSTTLVATSAGFGDSGHEDPTVQAIGRLGARAYVARPFQSASYYVGHDGTCHYYWDEEKEQSDFEKAKSFATKYAGAYGGRVDTMLFPYRLDACTPELLRQTKAAAKDLNVKIRIHVAQFLMAFYEIIRRYAKTPVAFLADIDFLGPEVLLHHCLFTSGHSWLAYPDGSDIEILSGSGVSVSHSPLIFARRAVALESFHKYRQAGITMALGTDTAPPDMMMTMRLASLICKMVERDVNTGKAREVFNAATVGGANALGRDDLGRLEPGAKADIIIVDLEKMRIGPVDDVIRSLVHYTTMDDIRTVIVGGRRVVEAGEVLNLGLDETELLARAQKVAEKTKERIVARDWASRRAEEIFPPSFHRR